MAADFTPSLVHPTEVTVKGPAGILHRLDAIANEVMQTRIRLSKLQAKIDGLSEPQPNTGEVSIKGLKGALDRIESDLRGIARPLGALEELF
jgi:hypothetical protein